MYEVYVLSYRNKARHDRMVDRLRQVGLKATMFELQENDPRYVPGMRKVSVRFFNFMKMFETFLESDAEYGLFLEDDVYLARTIVDDLRTACEKMKAHDIQCLLVGYLIHSQLARSYGNIRPLGDTGLYTYSDALWGAQGFILSRAQARRYVDRYTMEYVNSPKREEMLESDYVFTKPHTKRALVYPPLVVEEGDASHTDPWQIDFHRRCARFLYDPARYL